MDDRHAFRRWRSAADTFDSGHGPPVGRHHDTSGITVHVVRDANVAVVELQAPHLGRKTHPQDPPTIDDGEPSDAIHRRGDRSGQYTTSLPGGREVPHSKGAIGACRVDRPRLIDGERGHGLVVTDERLHGVAGRRIPHPDRPVGAGGGKFIRVVDRHCVLAEKSDGVDWSSVPRQHLDERSVRRGGEQYRGPRNDRQRRTVLTECQQSTHVRIGFFDRDGFGQLDLDRITRVRNAPDLHCSDRTGVVLDDELWRRKARRGGDRFRIKWRRRLVHVRRAEDLGGHERPVRRSSDRPDVADVVEGLRQDTAFEVPELDPAFGLGDSCDLAVSEEHQAPNAIRGWRVRRREVRIRPYRDAPGCVIVHDGIREQASILRPGRLGVVRPEINSLRRPRRERLGRCRQRDLGPRGGSAAIGFERDERRIDGIVVGLGDGSSGKPIGLLDLLARGDPVAGTLGHDGETGCADSQHSKCTDDCKAPSARPGQRAPRCSDVVRDLTAEITGLASDQCLGLLRRLWPEQELVPRPLLPVARLTFQLGAEQQLAALGLHDVLQKWPCLDQPVVHQTRRGIVCGDEPDLLERLHDVRLVGTKVVQREGLPDGLMLLVLLDNEAWKEPPQRREAVLELCLGRVAKTSDRAVHTADLLVVRKGHVRALLSLRLLEDGAKRGRNKRQRSAGVAAAVVGRVVDDLLGEVRVHLEQGCGRGLLDGEPQSVDVHGDDEMRRSDPLSEWREPLNGLQLVLSSDEDHRQLRSCGDGCVDELKEGGPLGFGRTPQVLELIDRDHGTTSVRTSIEQPCDRPSEPIGSQLLCGERCQHRGSGRSECREQAIGRVVPRLERSNEQHVPAVGEAGEHTCLHE